MDFQGMPIGVGHWNKVMSWEKKGLQKTSICSTGDGGREVGEATAGGLLWSKRRIGFGAEEEK